MSLCYLPSLEKSANLPLRADTHLAPRNTWPPGPLGPRSTWPPEHLAPRPPSLQKSLYPLKLGPWPLEALAPQKSLYPLKLGPHRHLAHLAPRALDPQKSLYPLKLGPQNTEHLAPWPTWASGLLGPQSTCFACVLFEHELCSTLLG